MLAESHLLKKIDLKETTKKSDDFRFQKSSRLLKSKEFRFKHPRRYSSNFFLILVQSGKGRLGISLSKKNIRSSVARNRIKRLLREVFRHHQRQLSHYDIHFIGKAPLFIEWKNLTYQIIEKEFGTMEDKLKTKSTKFLNH